MALTMSHRKAVTMVKSLACADARAEKARTRDDLESSQVGTRMRHRGDA